MHAVAASSLLSRPVRVEGILLGHVVDVIIDAARAHALGLEVRCGDGEHRFLPFAAARVLAGEVVARTALALLDAPQLAFYARRGTTLRKLRRDGETVDDVEVDEGGSIKRIHVTGESAWRAVGA
jgi:hypothetical protein